MGSSTFCASAAGQKHARRTKFWLAVAVGGDILLRVAEEHCGAGSCASCVAASLQAPDVRTDLHCKRAVVSGAFKRVDFVDEKRS
jgi:hypothetical protein